MALQYNSGWERDSPGQQAVKIQRAPAGFAKSCLTYLFCGLAVSFALWFAGSLYVILADCAQFGNCIRESRRPGSKKIFPSGLDTLLREFSRFGLVITLFIYRYNAELCPQQFMTVQSGLAVGVLFLLAGLIRFVLLRV
jgi:hypothetical protein